MATKKRERVENTDLDAMLEHVRRAKAKCHADYDTAREFLKEHHGKMKARGKTAREKAEGLAPLVDELLEEGKLTSKHAKAAVEYLKAMADAARARTGEAIAFPATLPPGAHPFGKPVGTLPPEELAKLAKMKKAVRPGLRRAQ